MPVSRSVGALTHELGLFALGGCGCFLPHANGDVGLRSLGASNPNGVVERCHAVVSLVNDGDIAGQGENRPPARSGELLVGARRAAGSVERRQPPEQLVWQRPGPSAACPVQHRADQCGAPLIRAVTGMYPGDHLALHLGSRDEIRREAEPGQIGASPGRWGPR